MAARKGEDNKRKNVSSSESNSSSESEEEERKKKVEKKRKKNKLVEASSEDSEVPTKNKNHAKSNLIVDSDESDDEQKSDKEGKVKVDEVKNEKEKETKSEESDDNKLMKSVSEVEENNDEEGDNDDEDDDTISVTDSVIEKLQKIRHDELNREDVLEMKAWLGEVNTDIKKQLSGLQDLSFRHYWKKPQFGGGDDFLHGWQSDVKKYKEMTARLPKKLCLAIKSHGSGAKSGKKGEAGKGSPARKGSSPAKNTRSKSGIIKTSLTVAEDDKLKVASRPEISSVMQRFFDKVLAESGHDVSKGTKKFNLGPFTPYGTQRTPTGLTPTPSVAPSMMASDDSDLDSLASIRTDLPASDSVPVSRRSIASSLLKKIGRKYNDKKLNSMCLTKPRSILEATNKPQLLPTPGIPTTEEDLEDMSPDQMKLATFFRKETVSTYRDNFEVVMTKNGINEFTPILYQSRTRTKSKQIQDAATVKSVFGADPPPHLVRTQELKKVKKTLMKKTEKKPENKDESPARLSGASTPSGSMKTQGDSDSELRSERSESVLGESSAPSVTKKTRRKFRKFRSGFDYIRKKKKVKPDDETTPSRKRLPVRRHVNWPEECRDVAAEVRCWVVNKGLGETVLHKAARLQYHDVVVYCAESPDYDINVRDNAGYTPLHEACNRGHLDIAQVLCAHGAHVNAPGYKGMRPLHEAVENGHAELARLLLAYGADPMLTTYAGQTCLELCADVQCTQLVEGFLADLKGHGGEMWHFGGPARFTDPEEQGCELFSTIPVQNAKPGDQTTTDRQTTVPGTVGDQTSTEKQVADQTSTDRQTTEPGTAVDQTNTGDFGNKKVTQDLLAASEKLKKECIENPNLLIRKDEEVVKNETVIKEEPRSRDEKEDYVDGDNKQDTEKIEESEKKEENEENDKEKMSESEDEWDAGEMLFESSDSPLLNLYEVAGKPHKYLLLTEMLNHLKMTREELIIAAKTMETLELSREDFDTIAHCCVVGSRSRGRVSALSSVMLVRVTASIENLLNIEKTQLNLETVRL